MRRVHRALAAMYAIGTAWGCSDPTTSSNEPEPSTDLVMSALVLTSPSDANVGALMTFSSNVQNLGPDASSGGTVSYEAFGDVALGGLTAPCTEVGTPFPATVAVSCPVAALASGNAAGIEPFQIIAQSAGDVEVWATVSPATGETDPGSGNNRRELTVEVAAVTPEIDLSVTGLTGAPNPVEAGGDVTYTVQVAASAPVSGAVLSVLFTGGDAQFTSGPPGCTAVTGGVECVLGALAASPAVATVDVVAMLPTSGQVVTAQARIEPPPDVIDPVSGNNTRFTTTTVATPSAGNHLSFGDIVEAHGISPDTAMYTFTSIPGKFARPQLTLLSGNISVRLHVFDPAGNEIYPLSTTARGSATDLSSANVVFQMQPGGLVSDRYTLKISGAGHYRLGLGTGAGRLDPSFGPTGQGYVRGSTVSNFQAMDLMSDGGIIIIGEQALTRFDASGVPDPGFGTNGVLTMTAALGAGHLGYGVRVQPDGKFVVAATFTSPPRRWKVARFEASGVLDATFGNGGVIEIDMGASPDSRPVGVRFHQNGPDLDIIVAGDGSNSGAANRRIGIARLKPNGALDASFGTNGVVLEGGAGLNPTMVDIQADGSIILASGAALRRYTPSGARDTSFGSDGLVTLASIGVPGANIRGLFALPDGRILGLGQQQTDAFVMRLTSTGVLDATFAGGGVAVYHFGRPSFYRAATLDGAGRLVVVGRQNPPGGDAEWLVTRMSMDGVLDAGFGASGYLTESLVDEARSVMIDTQGRIVVGGQLVGVTATAQPQVDLARHLPEN